MESSEGRKDPRSHDVASGSSGNDKAAAVTAAESKTSQVNGKDSSSSDSDSSSDDEDELEAKLEVKQAGILEDSSEEAEMLE